MNLWIYNSFTKRKEIFTPITPGKVNIYVCGVTVYDRCHIGHARSLVVFDTIVRYLRYRGYEVNYVRNFTDIDDKIIKRANEEGIDWKTIAKRYIHEFYRDMDGLGIERATAEPKATDHVQDMIVGIQKLIDKGYAYQTDGDVFFAVDTFPEYGKLSGKKLEQLEVGTRITVDNRKKNPLDFALWKKSKAGEPTWESPWGKGRPGWHIECSVMANKYLGKALDIHGGGQDLIFPHHENEIAQSEAITGRPFARYWIHNGFVFVNQEKMSKSLGNIFSVQEALNQYHPEVLRLFLLSRHYRTPLDFSDISINEAQTGLERLYRTLRVSGNYLTGFEGKLSLDQMNLEGDEKKVYQKLRNLLPKFQQAMDDDFNTAMAIGHIFEATRTLNQFMELYSKRKGITFFSILSYGEKQLREMGKILGFLVSDPAQYLADQELRRLGLLNIRLSEIEAMIEERTVARSKKDWLKADRIREELRKRGVLLEDSKEKTTWRIASDKGT